MRNALLIFGMATGAAAFGGQSLNLTPGVTGQMNSQPLSGSQRVEFRIHNFTVPASDGSTVVSAIFFLNWVGVSAYLSSDNVLLVGTNRDSAPDNCRLSLAGRTDIFVRAQRDATNKVFQCEFWNSDGSGYVDQRFPITSLGAGTTEGVTGGARTTVKLAYLRIHDTLLPLGSRPPTAGAPLGTLANWALDGSLQDSSGHGPTISMSSASYSSTPSGSPAAVAQVAEAPFWSNWVALRAGQPNQLRGSNSFSLNDSDTLQYFWQQVRGPSEIIWSNPKAADPIVRGLVFGPYEVHLRVTDSDGVVAEKQLTFGAVAVDVNDVVIYANPEVKKILGPMIRFGGNPWTWADNRHKFLSDFFGKLLTTDPLYQKYWEAPRDGTVSLTAGSAVVSGQGTAFLTTFLCDGSYGDRITVRWLRSNGSSGFTDLDILSCQSNTALTLRGPWIGPQQTDRNYARANIATAFDAWAENINFYDVVLAHYALYYRSGLDVYRGYARTLADRFWESPAMDQGYTGEFPRRRALAGLVLRAIDGRPDLWPGLRRIMDANVVSYKAIVSTDNIVDVREEAYKLFEVSLGALFDPDETKRAEYLAAVNSSIDNRWEPQQQPAGNFLSGYDPESGEATLTNGSTSVTGSGFAPDVCATSGPSPGSVTLLPASKQVLGVGTNFKSTDVGKDLLVRATRNGELYSFRAIIETVVSTGMVTLRTPYTGDPLSAGTYRIFLTSDPMWMVFGATYNDLDPEPYTCTWFSQSTLTLDRPYSGTSGTKKIMRQNLVGRGTQPFMMGIVGKVMATAYEATGNPRAAVMSTRIASWISQYGYWEERKGLYYGRAHPGCEPDPQTTSNCADQGGGGSASRFLGSAIFGSLGAAYLLNGDPLTKSVGDAIYAGNFGKSGYGGPLTQEGFYNPDLDDQGFSILFKKAKDYGVGFGVGLAASWPAARLGPPPAPVPSSVPIAFDLASFPGAVDVRIVLTDSNGIQTPFACSSSPCVANIDARLGDYLYKIEYRSESGSVIATSDVQLLAVH